MLTEERVLGKKWSYRYQSDAVECHANFEILKVESDQKLGLYIYSASKNFDLRRLEDLRLDELEDLVLRNTVKELTDSQEKDHDEDSELTSNVIWVSSSAVFGIGILTFISGIIVHTGNPQKPWEAAVGAAFIIGALIAIAIQRN